MVRMAIDVKRDPATGRFNMTGALLVRLGDGLVDEGEVALSKRLLKDTMQLVAMKGWDVRPEDKEVE